MAGKRKIYLEEEDVEKVVKLLKDKRLDGWKRQRLQVLKMSNDSSKTLAQIGEEVGVAPSSVSLWLKTFSEDGMAIFLTKNKGNGPESWLTDWQRKQLMKKLAKGSFRRAEDVRIWLRRRFKLKVAPTTIYGYLQKCQAKLKVARPQHVGKNPAAGAAFKRELARRFARLKLPKKRPIRLWIMDEARVGLQPLTRRVWCLRRCRATAKVKPGFDWQYIWGALQIGGGGSEFLYTNGVDLPTHAHFLRQISERDPLAMHVIIQDGAGFHHRDGSAKIPENIRLINLPPYSPELNPVEKFWDIIKDRICNRPWDSIDELMDATTVVLKDHWQQPKKIFSLFKNSYLSLQANDT